MRKRSFVAVSAGTTCLYCGALVSGKQTAGDHMPIPFRNGGTYAVPCCTTCHDMKDRFTLEGWPDAWTTAVFSDWPKLSRETRIFLAKAASILSDAIEYRNNTKGEKKNAQA